MRIGSLVALAIGTMVSSAAEGSDFGPEPYLSSCSASDRSDCRSNQKQLLKEWPRALKGDYASQRNVAFCLADSCGGALSKNATLACSWRVVILAGGSPKITSADTSNLQHFCSSGLTEDDRATAMAQAARLFSEIYRRPMPPGPWMLSARPAPKPPVDLGPIADANLRFNAEARRIGFAALPVATPPRCTGEGAKVACQIRIGRSVGGVLGTDATGTRFRDVMLLRAGDGDAVEWINSVTTVIAMFEPDASPLDVKQAIERLHAPLMSGKTDFATEHDMPRARFTATSNSIMGLVLTAAPR